MSSITVAPQHSLGIDGLAYVIEDVAYSPLKVIYKSESHDPDLELRCNSCDWRTTLSELPEDSGYVQPDLCPACAKNDQLGHVRCESPADGTFPSGWN